MHAYKLVETPRIAQDPGMAPGAKVGKREDGMFENRTKKNVIAAKSPESDLHQVHTPCQGQNEKQTRMVTYLDQKNKVTSVM